MPGRQAKILTEPIIYRSLRAISSRDERLRDAAILMLSVRGGLRAGEIAGLDWEMVLDPRGRLDHCLALPDRIAKKGSGRRVPLHPELRQALLALVRTGIKSGPVILSRRGVRMQPNSIVNWFVALFAEIGAEGCSSHSGRRTFITHAARNAHKAGASLRDVQLLAGHRSIQVTQGYIEGDSDAQRRLVRSL
jgi:integrase